MYIFQNRKHFGVVNIFGVSGVKVKSLIKSLKSLKLATTPCGVPALTVVLDTESLTSTNRLRPLKKLSNHTTICHGTLLLKNSFNNILR